MGSCWKVRTYLFKLEVCWDIGKFAENSSSFACGVEQIFPNCRLYFDGSGYLGVSECCRITNMNWEPRYWFVSCTFIKNLKLCRTLSFLIWNSSIYHLIYYHHEVKVAKIQAIISLVRWLSIVQIETVTWFSEVFAIVLCFTLI